MGVRSYELRAKGKSQKVKGKRQRQKAEQKIVIIHYKTGWLYGKSSP